MFNAIGQAVKNLVTRSKKGAAPMAQPQQANPVSGANQLPVSMNEAPPGLFPGGDGDDPLFSPKVEGAFGGPSSMEDFDFDPWKMNGITRLPVEAYSGKAVLKYGLGRVLGWAPTDEIDPFSAANRLKRYFSATQGIDDDNAPEIPVQTGIELARQQLDLARNNLMSHMEAPPELAQMDPAQLAAYGQAMFPDAPDQEIADFGDVSPEMRTFTLAKAIAELFSGKRLGQVAMNATIPLNMAQKRLDVERQNKLADMEQNARRAAFNLENDKQRIAAKNAETEKRWGLKGEALKLAMDDVRFTYQHLLTQKPKLTEMQKKYQNTLFSDTADPLAKIAAFEALDADDLIPPETRASTWRWAQATSSRVALTEAKTESTEATTEKTKEVTLYMRSKRELLPKELQVKWGNLEERRRHNKETEAANRKRLQIMDNANSIKLRIANQNDATRNREIELKTPLWMAQAAAAAEGKGSIKDFQKALTTELGKTEDDIRALRKDILQIEAKLIHKDFRRNTAEAKQAKKNLEALRQDLSDTLIELLDRKADIQGDLKTIGTEVEGEVKKN